MAVIVMLLLIFAAVAGGSSSPAHPPSTNVRQKVAVDPRPPWPNAVAAQPVMKVEEEEDDEKDYAIWNPAPYFGDGGYGAPIPHPEDACSPHKP